MDAYEMIQQVRHDLGEGTEAHWTDLALLKRLAWEYRRVWQEVSLQAGDWNLKSAELWFADSEAELPDDCQKPVYLVTPSGDEVRFEGVREANYSCGGLATSFDEVFYTAYLQGNTIVVNALGVSGTWTLWYQRRLVDPVYGNAGYSSGIGALQFEAAMQPSMTDDRYNGLEVCTYDAATGARKLSATITDYVGATMTATIAGTSAIGDFYGSKLETPEEGDAVIAARLLLSLLAKPSSALDPKYFEYHLSLVKEVERTWRAWLETRIPGGRSVRISRRDHG